MKGAAKFITLILLMSQSIFAYAQIDRVIKIGSDGGFPPYTDIDENGDLVGFEIELGKAICTEIQIKCQFVQLSFEDLFPALRDKKVDALMSGLSVSADRLQNTIVSISYNDSKGRFVKLKSVKIDASEGALNGKKVGVEQGGVFEKYLDKTYPNELIITPYSNIKGAIAALRENEIDFVLGDATPLEVEFINKEDSPFEFFGPEITSTTYLGDGQAAYFRKEDSNLADQFSKAIRKLRSKREFQPISNEYFKKDVFPN